MQRGNCSLPLYALHLSVGQTAGKHASVDSTEKRRHSAHYSIVSVALV